MASATTGQPQIVKILSVVVLVVSVVVTTERVTASPRSSAAKRPGSCHSSRCDTTPPSVTITSPAPYASLSGAATIQGTAADDFSVSKVVVQVDGGSGRTASGTTSWSLQLNVDHLSSGSHILSAVATDAAGNSSVANVSVFVSAQPDPSPSPSPSPSESPSPEPSPSPSPSASVAPSPSASTEPSVSPSPSPSVSHSPTTSPSPSPSQSSGATTYYVSRNGDNTDGESWATAWSELRNIDWSVIRPGDTVLIDGGGDACASPYDFTTTRPGVDCGMEYDSTLTVGASGTPTAPITVRLASDSAHDGTAVLFGGRTTPLPYCHQQTYSASAVRQYGVLVGDEHDVVIDGAHRSGIMVYGAVQGVRVSSASATRLTFERMEVFDNGSIVRISKGYNSDEEGFSLAGGTNTLLRGDIIHDNGQDGVQDETRPAGSLNGLVFDTDWIYNRRENPLYPGYSFNEPQSTGCTHADAIQLYSGGPNESGLTVTHSILGPLVNQGLYPGDGGTGATWNNVTVTDSLLLAVSHNLITDNSVHGWTISQDTLFAPNGGFEIPSDGTNSMSGVVKDGGYVYTPGWSSVASSNVWWQGDPLPGSATNTNPQFASVPVGPYPATFPAYAAADFTPRCGACQGSSLHRLDDILARIDSLP